MPPDEVLIRGGFGMLVTTVRPVAHSDITLTAYAVNYLDQLETGEQTLKSYAAHIRDHLTPYFNDRLAPSRLADIRRGHMRAWQKWMTKEKGRAPKTVNNVRGLLIPMFEAACRPGEWGEPPVIIGSPMSGLKAPKKNPYARNILRTPAHAAIFFGAAHRTDPDFCEILEFMAGTAARWGEASAVMDDACHLSGEHPYVEVCRVARRVTGEGWRLEEGAKSKAGQYRRLPVGKGLAAMLESRIAIHGPGLLFPSRNGGLIQEEGNYWRDRWRPILAAARAAGLPYDLTIHGLRKSAINAMVEGKVDVVTVGGVAGHASPQTTLGVYTEFTGAGRPDVLAVVESFFGLAA
jgi:integrase